jgi:hypothetical protein
MSTHVSPFKPGTLLHVCDAFIKDHPFSRCVVRECLTTGSGSATLFHRFGPAEKVDLLLSLLSDLEISGRIQGDVTISDLVAADGDKERLADLIDTTPDRDEGDS